MSDTVAISDPRTLRAIAHPVRMQILNRFDIDGPQRAADIADALDIPANQASFHLRQLAKYGLVTEAPEHARDGRDRVWKLTTAELRVDTAAIAAMPGGAAAVQAFRTVWAAEVHDLVTRLVAFDDAREPGHFGHAAIHHLTLTTDEAREVVTRIEAVLGEYAGREAPDAATIYDVAVLMAPERLP